MGFSPGDFKTTRGEQFHFELKDGPRIVLWTNDEMQQLLSLDMENVIVVYGQLKLLINLAGGDVD